MTAMGHARRRAGRGVLICGVLAVAYGLVLGPCLDWLLGRHAGPALYLVAIAVGLLMCVCGYGRMSGWSR